MVGAARVHRTSYLRICRMVVVGAVFGGVNQRVMAAVSGWLAQLHTNTVRAPRTVPGINRDQLPPRKSLVLGPLTPPKISHIFPADPTPIAHLVHSAASKTSSNFISSIHSGQLRYGMDRSSDAPACADSRPGHSRTHTYIHRGGA